MKKMFVILAAMFAVSAAQAVLPNPTCPVDICNSSKTWLCHNTGLPGANQYQLIHPNLQGELNGHASHPRTDLCPVITGSCNTSEHGLNVYKDMKFKCDGSTDQPSTNSFDLGCENGHCETNILSSATFDFAVASGGVNQDLFVCEVGFRANDCENCNKGVDKIVVHKFDPITHTTPAGDVTINYPNSQTFTLADWAMTADVYLNSLDYSAGWFVRYCSKTTRLVVGTAGGDLAARISAKILVDGTENSPTDGYLAQAKVKFGVTHSCNGASEVFAPVLNDPNQNPHGVVLLEPSTALEIDTQDFLCLNGTSCGQEVCSWVIHFQETACTLRKIKDVTCTPSGALTCTPYRANIHTSLNLDTSFECITTGSGCVL